MDYTVENNEEIKPHLTDHVAGGVVMARAIELAIADGRSAINLSKTDWEKAKQELSGEAD